MKKFTRIFSLMLALIMVLSMAACAPKSPETPDESKPIVTDPVETEPTVTDSVETQPNETIDATEPTETAIAFFSMSFGTDYENVHSLTAFPNDDGTIYVEYVGDEKKVGNLDPDVLNSIAAELAKTELATLDGAEEYDEGEASGSMYIEFSDGDTLIANYTGNIHEDFINGYNAMDVYFQSLTADLEVYVPQPQVMGDINGGILNAMLDILNGSGIPNLDTIGITGLNLEDEYFSGSAGLTSADGIANAASAAPMMMAQAYSLVIVELAEGADAEAIGADFEQNIDWRKWVCVAPSNALIATKDNMVLCLQAADDMYTMTVAGIDAAGWTHVNELKNPDLG